MMTVMSAWDVRNAPAADKEVMTVLLYLPDMPLSFSHTISETVDRERVEIQIFHDVCLTSRMTDPLSLEAKASKAFRLSNVG